MITDFWKIQLQIISASSHILSPCHWEDEKTWKRNHKHKNWWGKRPHVNSLNELSKFKCLAAGHRPVMWSQERRIPSSLLLERLKYLIAHVLPPRGYTGGKLGLKWSWNFQALQHGMLISLVRFCLLSQMLACCFVVGWLFFNQGPRKEGPCKGRHLEEVKFLWDYHIPFWRDQAWVLPQLQTRDFCQSRFWHFQGRAQATRNENQLMRDPYSLSLKHFHMKWD